MRRDDLFAHLVMSGGAKPDTRDPKTIKAGVAAIHNDLIECCGFVPGKNTKGTFRKKDVAELLKRINTHMGAALQLALAAFDEAIKLEFRSDYEYVDDYGKPAVHLDYLKDHPIAYVVIPSLRVWKLSQGYSERQKLLLANAREFYSIWLAAKNSFEHCEMIGDYDGLDRLEKERDEARQEYEEQINKLPTDAKSILLDAGGIDLTFHDEATPTPLKASMDSEAIGLIRGRCSSLAQQLVIEVQASESMEPNARRQCNIAVEQFNNASKQLASLVPWIEAYEKTIAPRLSFRRCNVCYKHIGKDGRLYCDDHRRTSDERAPKDDLYFAVAYQRRIRDFFLSKDDMSSMFSDAVTRGLMLNLDHERQWAAGWVPAEMIDSVALLMERLRRLFVVVAPSLEKVISDHFMQMVNVAKEPFVNPPQDKGSYELKYLQEGAVAWLTIDNFFKTLYGQYVASDPKKELFHPGKSIWKRMDPLNPIFMKEPWRFSDHAMHLTRIRIWTEVREELMRDAYVDPERILQLRNATQADGRKLSYAEIARLVGYSKQTVANVCKPPKPDGEAKDVAKRNRVRKQFRVTHLGSKSK